jgi:hypothetical protein
MNFFDEHSEFFNKPVKLYPDQISNPTKVIKDFFGDFTLTDVRVYLHKVVECALTSNNSQFMVAKERSEIYHFAQRLEELAGAAYLVKGKK